MMSRGTWPSVRLREGTQFVVRWCGDSARLRSTQNASCLLRQVGGSLVGILDRA